MERRNEFPPLTNAFERPTPSAPPLTNAFSVVRPSAPFSAPPLRMVERRTPTPSARPPPLTRGQQQPLTACSIVCSALLTAIGIIAITFVAALIFAVGFPPYPKFGLNSLSVSRFNISGDEITVQWHVVFLTRNPNSLYHFSIEHPIISVFYKDQLLSEGVFPDLHLPRKTTKYYTANTVSLAARIEDNRVADAIARDWSERGVVSFTVRLHQTFLNRTTLNVTCTAIKVAFGNNSSSQGRMLQLYSPDDDTYAKIEAFARCSSYFSPWLYAKT